MMTISLFLVSILGAQATFHLTHKARLSIVRASTASTLVFSLLIGLTSISYVGVLQTAFFGATFVGMSDQSRLGWKRVFAASLIFALIFIFLIPLAKGIGGGLGAAAFVSSAIAYGLGKLIKKYKPTE